jgi:hypothetical protein
MSEPICIELPRSSDVADLTRFLNRRGLHAVAEPEGARIDVPGGDVTVPEVLAGVEAWLAGAHLPFVPAAERGSVVVRPPAS